jgi:hypothetical protein
MATSKKVTRTDPKKRPKVVHRYKADHKRGNKPASEEDCNRTIIRGSKQAEVAANCECGAKKARFKYEKQIVAG